MGFEAADGSCAEAPRDRLRGAVAGVDPQDDLAHPRIAVQRPDERGGDLMAVPAAAMRGEHPIREGGLAAVEPGAEQRDPSPADQQPSAVDLALPAHRRVFAQRSVGPPARGSGEERVEARPVPGSARDLVGEQRVLAGEDRVDVPRAESFQADHRADRSIGGVSAASHPSVPGQRLRAVAALLCILGAMLAALLTGTAPRADAAPPTSDPSPVRLMLVTSGLTWEDIDPRTTPTLQCLADRSGVGAMNTTSAAPPQTLADGLESLRSGYRGGAASAPRSAGVPNPPRDQWRQLPVGTERIDLTSADTTDAAARVASGITRGDLVETVFGSVPARSASATGTATRADAVRVLDRQVREVLAPLGGCGAADLPRTMLVSVAAPSPALQVVMDTGFAGQALTSGATKQDGIVVLTDVLPTILASHDAQSVGRIPGQVIEPVRTSDPQLLVRDRTSATRLVDHAQVVALGSWFALGLVGLVLLAVPTLARRPRIARIGRALATIGPLALPVGLLAQAVPWWRAAHPTLALTGFVWAGALLLAAIVLGGPWRASRLGPPGVAAALVALIVLGESALGSQLQVGSPLGAQPVTGGRFYGLSNHLFGLVLGASVLALLCLFSRVRRPRSRVIWTLAVGAVIALVCVAPTMGADFGSMLVAVPTFGLLALLVSGVRPRLWHVLALGGGGAAAVLAVSFLDWLRPAEQRTHLGRFIDDLLSGDLLAVIVRKGVQNLGMSADLAPLMVLIVVASIAVLIPVRLHWRRLVAFDQQLDAAYRVRVALVAGAWLGYAVNDTGPVLLAGVLAVWLTLLPAALPDPA